MKKKNPFLPAVFLLVAAPILWSQTAASDSLSLSLEEAWKRMESASIDLKTLSMDHSAALRELESRAQWIPGISAGTSLSRSSSLISGLTNPGPGVDELDRWSLRASLDLRLSFKPNLSLTEKAKILALEQILLSREIKIAEMKSSLKKLYYQILAGKDTIRVQEQNLSLSRARLDQIRKQFDQGLRSDLELLTAQIAEARDLPSLQKARTDQEKRMLTFRQFLGLPPDTPVDLTSVQETVSQELPSPDVLVKLTENTEAVRTARLQLETARINSELYRRNLLGPSLGISLGWSTDFRPVFDPDSWSADGWSDSLGLGLSLSVPIDPRLKGSSGNLSLVKLDEGITKLEMNLEGARTAAGGKLRSLLLDLDLSRANLEADTQNVALQEQNFKKLQESFESGRSSLLDLNNSRQELLKARMTLENEKLNWNLLLIDLERMTGDTGLVE